MGFRFGKTNYFHTIPNFITFLNLFTGFLCLEMVSRGKLELAPLLIILCLVWDSLDGNIARIFKNPSQIGRELDSLADIVSFVVAPAFLIAKFLLMNGITLWMLSLLFIYLAAGAYRLARFNVFPPIKEHFQGLPTPAAAIILSMSVLACIKNHWTDASSFILITSLLLILLSFLMVSQIPYPKFSAIKFSKWSSFLYLELFILLIVSIVFNVATGLAFVFLTFMAFSPIYFSKLLRANLKQAQILPVESDNASDSTI